MKYVIALGIITVFCIYGLLKIQARKRIADNQGKLPPLPFLLKEYCSNEPHDFIRNEPYTHIYPVHAPRRAK